MKSIAPLLQEITSLLDEVAVLTATSTPTPGGLLLSPVEFDLYEAYAEALDKKFATPWKVLVFLKKKLGYKRISEGEDVIVHYRQRGSSPLVAFFDGRHGEVVGVDEVGRPWVHFNPKDWEKARTSTLVKSRGQSPFDTDSEIIQSRLKAIRLDPLDTLSYRKLLAKIGYLTPKGELQSKNWLFNLPKSTMPSGINVYDGDDEDDEDEDGLSEEDFVNKESYYYDPLVTDLVSMSDEQMRFILDNSEEFLLHDVDDYIPEEAKKNFEDWNPPEGHVTGETRTALQKSPEHKVTKSSPSVGAPAKDYPLNGIEKGSPAHKQWKELMSSPNFRKVLESKPVHVQWAIAHHAHVLKCRKNRVKPFTWWTREHRTNFEAKVKKIHNNIRHKAKFKAKSGETPEQFRKRTGKCPKHFVWVEERRRCVHKDSV